MWAKVLFGLARRMRWVTAPLRTMSLIHFARWSTLDRLPGEAKRLPHPLLLFESNFDGALWRYVDAFAYVLGWRMRAVWWTSYDYPGLTPTDGFTAWTEQNSVVADHYYCAYPDASPTTVRAGLAVRERLDTFEAAANELKDDEFALEYKQLLTDVHEHL